MSVNKVENISTKLGDKGTSKNYNNETYRKSDILFETLGTIDELSSFLGLTYHYHSNEEIKRVQKNLQNIAAQIATSPEAELYKKLVFIKTEDTEYLETEMQKRLNIKPLEPRFYLPGSEKSKTGAYFDVCRTLARRVERRLDEFIIKHNREDLDNVRMYINRLSDYLFILSCTR